MKYLVFSEMYLYIGLLLSILFCTVFANGAEPKKSVPIDWTRVNRDESKVPPFTLPDPLLLNDGSRVSTAEQWIRIRRAELLEMFQKYEYGRTPKAKLSRMKFEILSRTSAVNDKADLLQIAIYFTGELNGPKVHMLLFVPKESKDRVPVFVGLNFRGNYTVSDDPNIQLLPVWTNEWQVETPVPAQEKDRGRNSSRWCVEKLVDNGFALATVYYKEADPDVNDGFVTGVHTLFEKTPSSERADDNWGKIGSWAWTLSRMLDCLETIPEIDTQKAIVIGHSRLGKTALWAGAQDERFAIVISNNSGCGGAALGRRFYGEFPKFLSDVRPHWFCPAYNRLSEPIEQIPIDQHELIALIAPRPVYIASATEDSGADPKGEFLAALHADPVYRLLGTEGFGNVNEMPVPDRSVGATIGYHLRTGKHNITPFDWDQYIAFAKKHFAKSKTKQSQNEK